MDLVRILAAALLLTASACAAPVDGAAGPPGGGSAGVGGKADGDGDGPPPSRVELKLTLESEDEEALLELLGVDEDDGEQRAITFFDSPDLALFEAGIVLRARSIRGDDDDSTVKIRPLLAEEAWAVVPELFDDEEFKCEIDRTTSRQVSSCSLGAEQHEDEIEDVHAGERDVDKLFSGDQEDLFALFAPAGVEMDDTMPFGPVETVRWKERVDELDDRKLTVERWSMPDGSVLLEHYARRGEAAR